jgi:hypothetical protein
LLASRKLVGVLAFAVALIGVVAVTGASAGSGNYTGVYGTPTVDPQLIDDSSLKASTTTDGGADVTPTTRTVAHWHGSSLRVRRSSAAAV